MRNYLSCKAAAVVAFVLWFPGICQAVDKVKIRGYITASESADKVLILDDVIHMNPGIKLEWEGGDNRHAMQPNELQVGVLIEAEGTWAAKHDFRADKITADAEVSEKTIKEKAFIAHLPTDVENINRGLAARLKLDGELLVVNPVSQRSWPAVTPPATASEAKSPDPASRYLGRQVEYKGVRQSDGTIAVQSIELGALAPPGAYKIPDNITVARAQDPGTHIDIIEFRKGKKTEGRMKLFPVPAVQEYVGKLGTALLPAGADSTTVGLEFRFFVIEDPSINASALPDGTILVHTGLLGAVDNEAQLAFVLSHEIAHVLQAHHWRHVTETRPKRVLITIAAIVGSYYIGDLGRFLGAIGLEAVVNGYSRRLEDQADRIALQNMIELGYDPRQGPAFSRIMIDRYSIRSTSKVFSTHNSPVLRGSFLTVQISRQYPEIQYANLKADTEAFRQMKEAMGPVKIQ
jgi:hypothetical protein